MKKRQIQYNIENFKSRIPGLFTYYEDGNFYSGTSSSQGCYGKYVCDLLINIEDLCVPLILEDEFGNLKFEKVIVDNNFNHIITVPIFDGEKNIITSTDEKREYIYHSYKTLIDIYYKYSIIKDIEKQKYYYSYNNEDVKDKINRICLFLEYISRGIGYLSIDEIITVYNAHKGYVKGDELYINEFTDEEYLVPNGIYLSTAYDLLNEMKYLESSCKIYNEIEDEKKSEYFELCCNCQKFKLMGGDKMIRLLEYCSEIAENYAAEYSNYTNKKINFNVNIPLLSTSIDLGIFQQNRNIWEPGKEYIKGEIVYYNGDTYLCLGKLKEGTDEILPSIGFYNSSTKLIEFPYKISEYVDEFIKIKDIECDIKGITEMDSNPSNNYALKNVFGGQKFISNQKLYDENGEQLEIIEKNGKFYYYVYEESVGITTEIECDRNGYVLTPFLSGKTSSRLNQLRRYKNFVKDNTSQYPSKNTDWLFYYKKGVVKHKKLVDNFGNILKFDETKTYSTNYYVYGDVLNDIYINEDENSGTLQIVFEYVINAHLKVNMNNTDEFETFTDSDGQVLEIYKSYSLDKDSDNGIYHGIYFYESYPVIVGSELESLYRKKEYFLVSSSLLTNVGDKSVPLYDLVDRESNKFVLDTDNNGNETGYCRCYYTFEEYVESPQIKIKTTFEGQEVELVFTIPDNKKYEFDTSSNIENRTIVTGNGVYNIEDKISYFKTNIDYTVDYEYNNLYKEEYLLGVHYQPYVKGDINIERGNGDAFETFCKLTEVKTMQDLENYQNGGFFKIEKVN